MTGHIFLISCLLAICLPIVFVQLPRFETVKEMRAEIEAENRSAVLQRRSPSPSQKILRWITLPWYETDIDINITVAGSGQEQVDHEKVAQTAARGRWDQGDSGTAFGADACADSGASSKEEGVRTSKVEKKPWDPPFRRQFARPELARKSIGGRLHQGTDTPLRRKTGRDMEARGVTMLALKWKTWRDARRRLQRRPKNHENHNTNGHHLQAICDFTTPDMA
ncbi:hypothetical protein N0V95_004207 [Ascochyta clinopodiicola]|nr:hypothetical protein N0V95_004207 [Ascochyta clinopodiicola]